MAHPKRKTIAHQKQRSVAHRQSAHSDNRSLPQLRCMARISHNVCENAATIAANR